MDTPNEWDEYLEQIYREAPPVETRAAAAASRTIERPSPPRVIGVPPDLERAPRESFDRWRRRVILAYRKDVGEEPPTVLTRRSDGLEILSEAIAASRAAAAAELQSAWSELLASLEEGKATGELTDADVEAILTEAGWGEPPRPEPEGAPRIDYLLDYVEWAVGTVGPVGAVAPAVEERGVIGFASALPGDAIARRPSYRWIARALDPQTEYEFSRKLYQGDRKNPRWDNRDWRSSRIRGGGRGGDAVYTMRGRDINVGLIKYMVDDIWQKLSQSNLLGFVGIFKPVRVPGRWLPMRRGELNCFVEALLPYYPKKRKMGRGHKSPREILLDFEQKHHDSGIEPEDVWLLEPLLKARFRFVDINGELLATSGKEKGKYREFVLVRHNGHCFEGAAPSFPKDRVSDLLRLPVLTEPLVDAWVTECGGGHSKPKEQWVAAVCSLVSALPAAARAWIVGEEVVVSDGRVLRSQGLMAALREAARIEGVEESQALSSVGGVQSFRFKCWLQKNGIGAVHTKVEDVWANAMVEAKLWCRREPYQTSDVFEIDMRACFLACEDPSLGRVSGDASRYVREYRMPSGDKVRWASVSSLNEVRGLAGSLVRFRSWRLQGHDYLGLFDEHLRENEGLIPTPLAVALLDLGFLAEHHLAEVGYEAVSNPPLRFLDTRDKRLGDENKRLSLNFIGSCVKRPTRSLVVVDDEEAVYLHNALLRAGSAPTSEKMWEGSTVIKYTEAGDHRKHPHVRAYVLAYAHIGLLSKLKEHPSAVRIACDSLTLPNQERSRVTTFRPKVDPKWPDAKPKSSAYPPGVWREKEGAKAWSGGSHYFALASEGGAREGPDLPRAPSPLSLMRPLTYNNGQGGSGKTTSRIKDLSGRRVAVLGKDWWNVLDLMSKVRKASDEGFDMSRFTCHTWHGFWHVGTADEQCEQRVIVADASGKGRAVQDCGKCIYCTGWTEERMRSEDHARRKVLPEFILWDEIGFVPAMYARPILRFCAEQKISVIACADLEGQMRQFRDRDVSEDPMMLCLLRELGANVITETEDRRSLCELLKALKASIWKSEDRHQRKRTRETLVEVGAAGSLNDALLRWKPIDTFAVATNDEGKTLQKRLLAEHGKRFPDHKVPMRFRPPKSERKQYSSHPEVDYPGYLTGEKETVKAFVGARVWIDYEAAIWYLANEPNQLWVYDGWRTVHSLQGITIGDVDADEWPTLFIVAELMGRAWNSNSIYTAVSRVRKLSQLYWVDADRDHNQRMGELLQQLWNEQAPSQPAPATGATSVPTSRSYDLDDVFG